MTTATALCCTRCHEVVLHEVPGGPDAGRVIAAATAAHDVLRHPVPVQRAPIIAA